MKKETDLAGVKAAAQALLMTEIHKTPFSPAVVQHPFTASGFIDIPSESNGFIPADITANKENLRKWQTVVRKAIDKADNPYHVYLMINPPYALTFLKLTAPYLSQKDFSEILSSAWIMSEAPHNDPDVSVSELVSMFQSADPIALMEQDEYIQFKALEDTVTVYRGVTLYNAENVKALSWTLNRETAEWFAHRFDGDGKVYEAQIDKAHILAVFNGRNEAEIIVDPQYLTELSEVQEIDDGFMQTM